MSRATEIRAVPIAAAALAATVAACTPATPTEVVVEIATDLSVPDELNGLTLTVSRLDGDVSTNYLKQSYALGRGPDEILLPRRLTLIPGDNGAPTIRIVADGTLAGTVIVSRTAILGFVRGRSLFLRIELLKECVGKFQECETQQPPTTCVRGGRCQPPTIVPETLGPVPPPDASAVLDAAVGQDLGTDGTPGADGLDDRPRPDLPGSDAAAEAGGDGPPDGAADTGGDTAAADARDDARTDGPADLPVDTPADTPGDAPADTPTTEPRPDLPGPDAGADGPTADAPADAPADVGAPDTGGRPLGMPCTNATQCASGRCVDDVCCANDCSGTCMACDLPSGPPGTCAAVPNGDDPDGDCDTVPASTCQRDGFCDGRGACRLYDGNTQCRPPACVGSNLTTARLCDGMGTCGTVQVTRCPGNFACADATTCHTACTTSAECAPGYNCSGGGCTPIAEDCTNGADDDGDQRVDCDDPECQSYTCAPMAPAGWSGPVAVRDEPTMALLPTCQAPYPIDAYTGRNGLSCGAAQCGQCACGPATGIACAPPEITLWNNLGNPGCEGTKLLMTASTACGGIGFGGFTTTDSVATGGSCLGSHAADVIPPVAFARAGVACAAATGAGGGCSMAGYQCLPMLAAPFESTFCVFRSGDVACPGTFQARRRVFYGGVDDDRRCTTCTCDPPSTRECADSMFLSTEPDCSIGQSYDVPVTTCAETGGIVAQYLTYTLEGATGSCPPNPAGGMPAGSCTAETPTTVCCL